MEYGVYLSEVMEVQINGIDLVYLYRWNNELYMSGIRIKMVLKILSKYFDGFVLLNKPGFADFIDCHEVLFSKNINNINNIDIGDIGDFSVVGFKNYKNNIKVLRDFEIAELTYFAYTHIFLEKTLFDINKYVFAFTHDDGWYSKIITNDLEKLIDDLISYYLTKEKDIFEWIKNCSNTGIVVEKDNETNSIMRLLVLNSDINEQIKNDPDFLFNYYEDVIIDSKVIVVNG